MFLQKDKPKDAFWLFALRGTGGLILSAVPPGILSSELKGILKTLRNLYYIPRDGYLSFGM